MSTRPKPPEFRAAAVADYITGMTCTDVARTHGVSSSAVSKWLKEAGVTARTVGPTRISPDTCTLNDCQRTYHARGYCRLHYAHHIEGATPRDIVTLKHDDRLEDCRWMAEHGETLTGAARRLGMARESLEAWLTKHDAATMRVLRGRDLLPEASRATFHGVGQRASA